MNRHHLAGDYIFQKVLSKLKLVDSVPLVCQLAVVFVDSLHLLGVWRFAFPEHWGKTQKSLHTCHLQLVLEVLKILNNLSLVYLIFEIRNMGQLLFQIIVDEHRACRGLG